MSPVTPPTVPPTDLDARYGRRPPRSPAQRTALAVVGIGAAVLAVVAFYLWWAADQDAYSARVQSYEVTSDTSVSTDVEVTNHGSTDVRCEIVAKDRSTQVVGTSVIQAPPADGVTVVADHGHHDRTRRRRRRPRLQRRRDTLTRVPWPFRSVRARPCTRPSPHPEEPSP